METVVSMWLCADILFGGKNQNHGHPYMTVAFTFYTFLAIQIFKIITSLLENAKKSFGLDYTSFNVGEVWPIVSGRIEIL